MLGDFLQSRRVAGRLRVGGRLAELGVDAERAVRAGVAGEQVHVANVPDQDADLPESAGGSRLSPSGVKEGSRPI